MTTTNVTPPSAATEPIKRNASPSVAELALLAIGLVVMYVPTYITLDKTIWNIVGQGHGPVMLALTLWLAYQRWPALMALPQKSMPLAGGGLLLLGLIFYVLGRSQDMLFMEAGSQIFVLSGIFLLYRGGVGLKTMLFPLFFILFLIPIPNSIVDQVTGPLKSAVSQVAEEIMYRMGFPIGRSGVMLTIGPYQLLVADACAGLNSIFALEAIGVFYMSVVQHASKWRNVALAIFILPISFVSNVIRVIALVLVTYYFGDAVGQGFVHEFAGILLFMAATVLTIAVDSLIGLFVKSKQSAS